MKGDQSAVVIKYSISLFILLFILSIGTTCGLQYDVLISLTVGVIIATYLILRWYDNRVIIYWFYYFLAKKVYLTDPMTAEIVPKQTSRQVPLQRAFYGEQAVITLFSKKENIIPNSFFY
jgi:hypothetical protein